MGRHRLLDNKQQRSISCCVSATSDLIVFDVLFVQVHAICVSAVFVSDLADCSLCMGIMF